MSIYTKTNSTKKIDREKIVAILNSKYMMLFISLIIVLCWAFDFPYVSLTLLLLFLVAVLFFCGDNPKAFAFPLVIIYYSITSLNGGTNRWVFYFILISILIASMTIYIINQKIKHNKQFKKGQMFWFFVLSTIGNCIGGLVGFFEFKIFLIVLAFCLLVYFLYWFFINFFTKDAMKYFAYSLLFLSLIITLELIISYARLGNFLNSVQNKLARVGTGEINSSAIFMLSGVCACFYLAKGSKKDYLYILLALLIDISIFFTYSRIAIMCAALTTNIYFFVILKHSLNKKWLIIAVSSMFGCILIFALIFNQKVIEFIGYYLKLGFSQNGRESLWEYSFNEFLKHPIFGTSFITRDPYVLADVVPGITVLGDLATINTHNIFLHYLTCTGIVGALLNFPLYIKKYMMVFENINDFKIFALFNYACIFVSSCFDPTPTDCIFHIVISLLFYALVEIDNEPAPKNQPVTKIEPTQNSQPLSLKEQLLERLKNRKKNDVAR